MLRRGSKTTIFRKVVLRLLPVNTITTSSAIKKMDTISSENMKSTFRLSQLVRPVNYRVKLNPNLKVGTFSGTVNILLNVLEKRTNITLHSKALCIKDVSVTKGNKAVAVSRFCENKELEQLQIETKECLSPGDYCLSIEFSGDLKNKIVGFYSSEYKDRVMVSSKFQPTYARQAFPCFDEPDFKAPFDITLVKPAGYVALSNMNEISSVHDPKTNTDTVSFATSVPMSTYLACFVLCEFAYKEVEINTNGVGQNFKLRAYAQKEDLHKIDFALDIAKRATEFYINYYQVPYPLPKLDMIAIPNYISGATEHWGLVTFRETSFLLEPRTASASTKLAVAHTVAHELAHMWFGNLVTMKWWDDIWLNEGFASYMEVKSLNSLQPTWTMLEQFLTKKLHPVLELDGSLSSHPIVQTADTPDEITALFDTISYSKGASLLRMLEGFVGAENFRRGVTAYLNKYKFGNSVTKDLLDVLEPYMQKQHSASVSKVMATWSLQMGYPLLSVRRADGAGSFVVTQRRFLNDPDADSPNDQPYNYRWYVPITYKSNLGESKDIVWFPDSEQSVNITVKEGSKWLKLNNDQVGYYRVNYTEELWRELSHALHTQDPQLSTSDRAQLVGDALSLAQAHVLPYARALQLAAGLRGERGLVPWEAAARGLGQVARLLRGVDAGGDFKKYMQYLILPLYKEMSWEPAKLTVIQGLLRTKILGLALKYSLPDAEEKVRSRFLAWLATHGSAHPATVEPDLRDIVYTYGVQLTSSLEWERVWSVHLAERDVQERARLRRALASSTHAPLLQRFLTLAWDENNVRSQDYLTVLQSLSETAAGEVCAWDLVRSRWPDLVQRFSLNSRYLGAVVPAITSAFATEDKLKEMETFFAEYPEAGAGSSGRRRALETVRNNIAWRARSSAAVLEWLQHFHLQQHAGLNH